MTEIRQPVGTFHLMHPTCATCADQADAARSMAIATGSKSAAQQTDHRAADGTVRIDHSGSWTRTPTPADDAAYLAAEQRTHLETTVWSAWSDTSRAADAASCQVARLGGAEQLKLAAALKALRQAEAALSAVMTILGSK